MNQKKERFILGGISIFLASILFFFILAPALFGQSAAQTTKSLSGPADPKYAQMFSQVMNFVLSRYVDEVDPQKLFDGAMKGMFESLEDPYSVYLTESEMMNLNDTTSGEFGGVGLYINKVAPSAITGQSPEKDQYVEVISPIEDTPAYKAGIVAGDYISAIDGESTKGMTIDKVLGVLRGKPDTDVKVTILRDDDIFFDVTLRRAKIEVPTLKSATIAGSLGYIRIIQFTAHTSKNIKPILENFVSSGVKGLIIDLRSNPGGLLDSVVNVADNFFKDGVIVSTRSRLAGENVVFSADEQLLVPEDLPIVVLIDKGSASASEILAGAFKDRKRAFLLGETTYGKGSVQQIIPFDRTGFKMTMARYYTPSGVNIDKVGVSPDKSVPPQEFSDAELQSYKKLIQERRIEKFIQIHKRPAPVEVAGLLAELKKDGIVLQDKFIRKLVSNESDRLNNIPSPVFDLDYDQTLADAVKILQSGELTAP